MHRDDFALGVIGRYLLQQHLQSMNPTHTDFLGWQWTRFVERGYRCYAPQHGIDGAISPSNNRLLLSGPETVQNTWDWDMVLDAPREDFSSLICYTTKGGRLTVSPHPVLRESYDNILLLNDLSYALANAQSSKDAKKLEILAARTSAIKSALSEQGWRDDFPILFGATGALSQDPDASCVASYHSGRKLIVIAFHGSRNGSKVPWVNGNSGDWGTNYHAHPETVEAIGIENLPAGLKVHAGFGNNFKSAQDNIHEYLNHILASMTDDDLKDAWVIVTGHSRGAGLANVAAPAIKMFFQNHPRMQTHGVHVGAVLFSAPRSFHGDVSRNLVHNILGKRNVVRINVHGDPVPQTPPKMDIPWGGYRSVGVVFLDMVDRVRAAAGNTYGGPFDLLDPNTWAAYHFGCNGRKAGTEFDPKLVPPVDALQMKPDQESANFFALPQNPAKPRRTS
jgi:hypothetical protein